MAARSAIGATVRTISKPRKFAARRAAITLVSLIAVIKLLLWVKLDVKLCRIRFRDIDTQEFLFSNSY